MAWIGRKKIAFIPVFRPNAHPPDVIPADWNSDILRRVLFDPDTKTGMDRSLRAYIHTTSSGRADLDAVVMPMATIDLQDVRLEILDERLDGPGLRNQGFDAAAIVMLGGVGAGTAQKGGFWARFVMAEKLGTWAMELMHVLTGFDDIRCQPGFVDCRTTWETSVSSTRWPLLAVRIRRRTRRRPSAGSIRPQSHCTPITRRR
jgi:hypothetical protein